MQTAPVDEILRAIDTAAKATPGGAIAFDGDGTLWSGDIGEDFFDAAMKHGPLEVTREPLAREAVEGASPGTCRCRCRCSDRTYRCYRSCRRCSIQRRRFQ